MQNAEPGLPETFLARLKTFVSKETFDGIFDGLSQARPTTFRANTLKVASAELQKNLASAGFTLKHVPWYDDAFILIDANLRALMETPEYQSGSLYVQSLSSMLPPLVLDPKPGEKVLDITAAPGSKTTQMAMLMQNQGIILANDSSHVRIYRLKANLEVQGVTIANVTKSDARAVWQQYPEYFDKTLVDVPCSMEGRFQVGYPKTYQDWSLKKVRDLSHLQRWILRSAISATKPGGTIVYSTCTVSPEENEEVIDWILEKEKGNVVLEDIHIASLETQPAVLQWGTKTYDESIRKSFRIFPSATMEGFYIAKLKKLRTSLPKTMTG